MQPTEGNYQPRRALDVEDYIDILRRHKGWIFGPFLLVLVVSVVGVYLWPDTYESRATISIKPPQIAANMFKGAPQMDMVDRINQLSNQVLSRNELSNMIRTMNLYRREVATMPPEDVIELMRKKIQITAAQAAVGGKNVPAFQILFTYPNRIDATKVVNQLVTKFLDENLKNRSSNTFQQQDFFISQVEQAKKRLDEADAKVTEFRLAHPGSTPDQGERNISQMSVVQATLSNLQASISRAQSEKFQLETQIRNYRDLIEGLERDSRTVVAQVAKAKNPKLVQAEQELEILKQNMIVARKTYTETFPEVRRLKGYIDSKQEQIDRLLAEEAAKPAEVAAAPPTNLAVAKEVRAYNANIQQTESLIKTKDVEIDQLTRQQRIAADQLAMLNARVSSMPTGDQEYTDLLRQQRLASEEYLRQSQFLNEARIQVDMENRKQGETLEQLDPASQATEPSDPNRPLVISVGAALGLVVGIVLAGAREMKDTSLKNLKDVRAYTQMAILGSVPLLENDFVVRRRRRIAWLGWTVACLSAAVLMAGSIVYYYSTR